MTTKDLSLILKLLLTLLFTVLATNSLIEVSKKHQDDERINYLLEVQKAIDLYYANHQVYPFGTDQTGENYKTLIQNYLGDKITEVKYDPDPAKSGLSQGHPECYQFIKGVCYGRYVFDEKTNIWYIQVLLSRETTLNGNCKFKKPSNRYCVASQQVDNPY